jgi:hypothetical protein
MAAARTERTPHPSLRVMRGYSAASCRETPASRHSALVIGAHDNLMLRNERSRLSCYADEAWHPTCEDSQAKNGSLREGQMHMITKTALAAALIATASIGSAEDSAAQADDYAVSRIQVAFEVVSGIGSDEADSYPLVLKGDLLVPLACFGTRATQAKCPDVAFQVPPAPSIVVETRIGNTSILTRIDADPGTDVIDEELPAGAGT